jgi:hypothetical protein
MIVEKILSPGAETSMLGPGWEKVDETPKES